MPLVVDPGQRAMIILRRILDENRLTPAAVLLTHGHIDHIWSAQKVADNYGCPAFIHPEDRHMLSDPIRGSVPAGRSSRSARCSREPGRWSTPTMTAPCSDFGGVAVTVDHTPGHTWGSVVFRVDGRQRSDSGTGPVVFTGDTLFQTSVGRTICRRQRRTRCFNSIDREKLLVLDDTLVATGTRWSSTIGHERRTNPFLEGLT